MTNSFHLSLGLARSLRHLGHRQGLGLPVTPICAAEDRNLFSNLIQFHMTTRTAPNYVAMTRQWNTAAVEEWGRSPDQANVARRQDLFLKVTYQLKVFHEDCWKRAARRESIDIYGEANRLLRAGMTLIVKHPAAVQPAEEIRRLAVDPDL